MLGLCCCGPAAVNCRHYDAGEASDKQIRLRFGDTVHPTYQFPAEVVVPYLSSGAWSIPTTYNDLTTCCNLTSVTPLTCPDLSAGYSDGLRPEHQYRVTLADEYDTEITVVARSDPFIVEFYGDVATIPYTMKGSGQSPDGYRQIFWACVLVTVERTVLGSPVYTYYSSGRHSADLHSLTTAWADKAKPAPLNSLRWEMA